VRLPLAFEIALMEAFSFVEHAIQLSEAITKRSRCNILN
jgi:hypothetical protein